MYVCMFVSLYAHACMDVYHMISIYTIHVYMCEMYNFFLWLVYPNTTCDVEIFQQYVQNISTIYPGKLL